MKSFSKERLFSAAILAIAFACAPVQQILQAQPAPPDANASTDNSATLPTDIQPGTPLAQAVQMAQSGVDESVIMSYINNSGAPFNLTSDQIIYLKDLGLPNEAVTAMMQRDQQLGAAETAQPQPAATNGAPMPAEQPTDVTQNYFYDTLSPYGGWVNVTGYGLCWRPTVVIYDSSWQPYCQHGHWIYTDAGWYWLSDYSWGACAFHYGRWFHDAHFGWCWWPETTWAPSWVCWRYSNNYCGWAPLPPRCIFRPGVGIVFNGAVVSAGFDFGIGVNFFTFVPARNFCDTHPDRFRVKTAAAVTIFNHTTIVNNFNFDNRNHFIVNNGISRDKIAAISKTSIPQVAIRETTSSGFGGERFERASDAIIVSHPQISASAAATLNSGVRPKVVQYNAPRPLILNGNQNNFRTTPPRENNFSQNPQNQPAHDFVTPSPKPQPSETRETLPAQTSSGNDFSQSANANAYQHSMSPRQQEFEEQSSHNNYNARNYEREIPVTPLPPERSEGNASAPAQSAPPAQKSGNDKDQNGH